MLLFFFLFICGFWFLFVMCFVFFLSLSSLFLLLLLGYTICISLFRGIEMQMRARCVDSSLSEGVRGLRGVNGGGG